MSQTPLTIKIDSKVKTDAQKLAKSLGLSLSAIIENQLREVVRDRRVVFEESPVPNKQLAKAIRQAEADIESGKNIAGPFSTIEEFRAHMEALNNAHQDG